MDIPIGDLADPKALAEPEVEVVDEDGHADPHGQRKEGSHPLHVETGFRPTRVKVFSLEQGAL